MGTGVDHDKAPFPEEFTWGVATSAYQIEGAAAEDGRQPSIWDTFSHQEGAVRNGDTGDVACDHYHRFREDVQLMHQLQVPAYRFSISWPRVLAADSGTVNDVGLAFYDALVDELLSVGIEPWVTLFHWDLPQFLQDRGGWLNPKTIDCFADYTEAVVRRLSDRVRHWITINEPQCIVHFGHGNGSNAPGLRLNLRDQLVIAHHILLAHGRSVAVIRELARTPPKIGCATVGITMSPATETVENIAAAQRATMSVDGSTLWNNTWFSDPMFLGQYPEEGILAYGTAVPKWDSHEMEAIRAPLDFLGLNIYTATPVVATDDNTWREVPLPTGTAHTDMQWPVTPECLYWGPRFHAERYGMPIVITENGMANIDCIMRDSHVNDPQRIDYVHRHLLSLQRCIGEGFDVQGYFHWSLMDNFEWAEGFQRRFGLIYIDFESGYRIPKSSAYWYRRVIHSNGDSLFL